MSFVKNYLTNVCEIENFYDEDDAEKILEKFKKSQNWDHIIQKKPEHYSHVFKADGPFLKIYYEFFLSLLKFFIKYKILGFLFKDKF